MNGTTEPRAGRTRGPAARIPEPPAPVGIDEQHAPVDRERDRRVPQPLQLPARGQQTAAREPPIHDASPSRRRTVSERAGSSMSSVTRRRASPSNAFNAAMRGATGSAATRPRSPHHPHRRTASPRPRSPAAGTRRPDGCPTIAGRCSPHPTTCGRDMHHLTVRRAAAANAVNAVLRRSWNHMPSRPGTRSCASGPRRGASMPGIRLPSAPACRRG